MEHNERPVYPPPEAPTTGWPAPPPPQPPQWPAPPPEYGGQPGYPGYTYGYGYAPATPQPRLAGFWWRYLAVLIDGFVVGIPLQFLMAPFFAQISRTMIINAPTNSADVFAIYRGLLPVYIGMTILSATLTILYDALLIGKWHGQTVGKRICNLRVVREDGGEVSIGHAFARSAMKLVSGWVLEIGYLWMLWNPKKQTWHDKVARTLVIKE